MRPVMVFAVGFLSGFRPRVSTLDLPFGDALGAFFDLGLLFPDLFTTVWYFSLVKVTPSLSTLDLLEADDSRAQGDSCDPLERELLEESAPDDDATCLPGLKRRVANATTQKRPT